MNGPGGTYNDGYIVDFEFIGAGDLDECNGMTANDLYGYQVTNSYPWVLRCHLRYTPMFKFVLDQAQLKAVIFFCIGCNGVVLKKCTCQ